MAAWNNNSETWQNIKSLLVDRVDDDDPFIISSWTGLLFTGVKYYMHEISHATTAAAAGHLINRTR